MFFKNSFLLFALLSIAKSGQILHECWSWQHDALVVLAEVFDVSPGLGDHLLLARSSETANSPDDRRGVKADHDYSPDRSLRTYSSASTLSQRPLADSANSRNAWLALDGW